jgi:hypothetical protein
MRIGAFRPRISDFNIRVQLHFSHLSLGKSIRRRGNGLIGRLRGLVASLRISAEDIVEEGEPKDCHGQIN